MYIEEREQVQTKPAVDILKNWSEKIRLVGITYKHTKFGY